MVSKKVFCFLLIYRSIKPLGFHFLSILQGSYCTPIPSSSFQCPSSGSEVQYAQSYTSMYFLFFCRFREFCTYSMRTVLPVLPPTLTKHTHADRYLWNRKSVVHQCLIRFHGIPLIPLSFERQERIIQDQIAETLLAINELKANAGENFTIKQMKNSCSPNASMN